MPGELRDYSCAFSPFSLSPHDLPSILLIDGLDEGHIVYITTIEVLKLTISYREERGGKCNFAFQLALR